MPKAGQPSIQDFIQAGYPCLFMPTVEPDVAERRVRAALKKLKMEDVDFGVWKATTGLMVAKADGSASPRKVTDDLTDALSHVEDQEKPIVAIFHNLRQFVDNYQVIQHMQDAIMSARLKGSHLIIVGPHLTLPSELKNLVTFCDCPLPTRKQLQSEFDKIVTAYADDIELPKSKSEREELLRDAAIAAVGLDSMGAENALALSLALTESVDVRVVQAQKEQEVRKSDVLEFVGTDETMENVGGFGAYKTWLNRRRRVFTDEAREYGLPYPKGVLIVGPAGTGKSLAAKATASYLRLPLLRLDMGKVFRSLVGESEAAIRMALNVTEAVSPVVLWMDEIDKGMAGMRGSGDLDSGVTARVVSTILTWRQETLYPVVLQATANDVSSIPPMVYRKGRLDEVWATDLPTESERGEIFQIHLRKRDRDPKKFDCKALAAATREFVGSEIEGVIEDAMFMAFDDDEEVGFSHIVTAIQETVPQATRNKEEIDAIREWVSSRARLVSGGEAPKKKGKVRQIRAGRKK